MTGVLEEALRAFLAVLDRYTLADLAIKPQDFSALFGVFPPTKEPAPDQMERRQP